MYLNEEGRRRLIQLFEERLLEEVSHPLGFRKPLGETIEVQAQRLKAALLGRGEYTPFYLRGQGPLDTTEQAFFSLSQREVK